MKKNKKKRKKSFNKRNIIVKLSKRLLNKDLAKYFDISLSSLYRYKNGQRKIPEFILSKGNDLLNLTPSKTTKKIKLKRKRFQKINDRLNSGINELTNTSTPFQIKQTFLYTGDYKDIEFYIERIKEKYGDEPDIVYRIIRERIVNNERFIDSTYAYSLNANKLIDNFKKILAKYTGSIIENDTFMEKIIIERTQYI